MGTPGGPPVHVGSGPKSESSQSPMRSDMSRPGNALSRLAAQDSGQRRAPRGLFDEEELDPTGVLLVYIDVVNS